MFYDTYILCLDNVESFVFCLDGAKDFVSTLCSIVPKRGGRSFEAQMIPRQLKVEGLMKRFARATNQKNRN